MLNFLNFSMGLMIGIVIGFVTGGILGFLFAYLLRVNHQRRIPRDRRLRRRVSFPIYCNNGVVALVERRRRRPDRRLSNIVIKN
jgi:hypothetical protein